MTSQAATLGTIPIDVNYGQIPLAGPPGSGRLVVEIDDETAFDLVSGAIVFDQTLTAADVGRTFVASSGTEFQEAVGFLTNGANDWIYYQFGGGGYGFTEGGYFHGDYTGEHGTDLAGAQIQSLSLHIDSLYFAPASVNDPVFPQDYNRVIGSVTIEGIPGVPPPVPEPSTSALLGLGLLGLAGLRRRTRHVSR